MSYKTAWRWWRAGKLDAYQAATGTVIVREPAPAAVHLPTAERVAVYARVSAKENLPNLEGQAERLVAYCAAKGYQVHQVVKEVGSGINDRRPKFLKLLADPSSTVIVLERKDRATRFRFRYLDTLLERQGRHVEVVNLVDNGREDVVADLVADLVAIVYSFCARLYGQRHAKRKTETIVRELIPLLSVGTALRRSVASRAVAMQTSTAEPSRIAEGARAEFMGTGSRDDK